MMGQGMIKRSCSHGRQGSAEAVRQSRRSPAAGSAPATPMAKSRRWPRKTATSGSWGLLEGRGTVFSTASWRCGKRLSLVRWASGTTSTACSGKIRERHARMLQAFLSAKVEAREALAKVIRENARQEGLRRRLADEGLEPPVPRWAETAFLGVLGIGDLTMTSVSFMVLNISDRPFVSWLPFSALTLAAIPVVGGMLGAAHFLGESIRARRHEPGLRQVIIGAASLAGGLCLALVRRGDQERLPRR